MVEPESQDRRLDGRRWDPGEPRDFEANDTHRDRKVCVEVKRGAVVGNPSDGAMMRPFGGVYFTFM
jgi:hypothetical protein